MECEMCHQKNHSKDMKDHPEVCLSIEIVCPKLMMDAPQEFFEDSLVLTSRCY